MLFLCVSLECLAFFFFKQKTAYEMRISDWSSDVCSSDLGLTAGQSGDRIELSARRVPAKHVGGMFTAPLLPMFVIPAAYLPLRRRQAARRRDGTRACMMDDELCDSQRLLASSRNCSDVGPVDEEYLYSY